MGSTGSNHHFDHGLHRQIRQIPFPKPIIAHFFSTASIIYSLHVGKYLQNGTRFFAQNEWSGERIFW